jgi:hypothetical protein
MEDLALIKKEALPHTYRREENECRAERFMDFCLSTPPTE